MPLSSCQIAILCHSSAKAWRMARWRATPWARLASWPQYVHGVARSSVFSLVRTVTTSFLLLLIVCLCLLCCGTQPAQKPKAAPKPTVAPKIDLAAVREDVVTAPPPNT